MLRHAWSRLIRKQWLILYPLALSIVGTLTFFVVYAADGEPLSWSAFFNANFDRWSYVRGHFITGFTLSPVLLAPILAGLAYCLFSALIRAPLFRAIAGHRYPLAPRNWAETARLSLFYFGLYIVTWVAPLVGPAEGLLAALITTVLLVLTVLVTFSDYVIVFEDIGAIAALRRSLKLVGRRPGAVLAILVVLFLVLLGIDSLYGLYFNGAGRVFILLPISQMLVESLVLLFGDLVLIFLYEELRRRSPS